MNTKPEKDNIRLPKKGILITGLNGSGKSTVCRLLAEKLNYFSMDVEDYYFIKSDIPYSQFHTLEETQRLMEEDIEKHKKFVFATVNCNWGEKINSAFKLAVLLKAPLDLRMKRINSREYNKFGGRVLKGGDLYESQLKFHNKVLTRTDAHMDKQKQYISCPVVEIDASLPLREIVDKICEIYSKKNTDAE